MPRVKNAAALIKKRKQEDQAKNKLILPAKGDRLINTNEVKRFDNPLNLGEGWQRHDSEEDNSVTITSTNYEEFMNQKRFILTMQEDLIAEDDIDEEFEQEEALVTGQGASINEKSREYDNSEVELSDIEPSQNEKKDGATAK